MLCSHKLNDWWKLEICIFKFTPCHLQKRAGQITEKPKGEPLEGNFIFFLNKFLDFYKSSLNKSEKIFPK